MATSKPGTQQLRKSERIPKPRAYPDCISNSRVTVPSLQYKALAPLPSLQERHTPHTKAKRGNCTKQAEEATPSDFLADLKLTRNKTSTPDRRAAANEGVPASPPTPRTSKVNAGIDIDGSTNSATTDNVQSHTMDVTSDSIYVSASISPSDQTQRTRHRSNSVPDLTITEKSLTEMLADANQSTLNSTIQGFKTLVSDSVIDNLPLTGTEQRLTRLNKLLLMTGKELQDTKALHQALIHETNATRAQLTIEEAAHTKAKTKLHHLQEQMSALKDKEKAHPTTEVPVLYFRGWRDVLSAHHPCRFSYKGTIYKSKEHAYCHEKLLGHNKLEEAEKVKKIRFASGAKSFTRKTIQTTSKEWEEKKGPVMLDIAIHRAQQSPPYREALLATVGKKLIHNMETDSSWGFGPDGKGKNLMGTTTEEVRERLIKGEITVDPAEGQKQEEKGKEQQRQDVKSTDTIIISDSMLRGIDNHLTDMEVELNILGGATLTQLRQKLGDILKNKRPQFVVIHCGTNDLENESMDNLKANYNTIISDALFYTQGTKVILSGIIYRLDKPYLNDRIDSVNSFLKSIQTETVLSVDHNATIRNLHGVLNRGGLHMKTCGTRIVSSNIALLMRSEGKDHPQQQTGRQWSTPKKTYPAAHRPNTGTQEMPVHNRFTPLTGDMAQNQPSYRRQSQWTNWPNKQPTGQTNRFQQSRPPQQQTTRKGQSYHQGRRQWPAQHSRPDTRRASNFVGRPNPPPRFVEKYRPQVNTRSSQYEEEPLPRPSQDRPVQDKEPSRMEGASSKACNADLEPLQALVITMSSLQENMARLIQQSKEAATASPSPVHSQQVHVQPASYPWQVNEPTPAPMAVPNQLHPFQLVDPANSNPNYNPIPVNQSGQNVQPGGQYSHPIWQRPIPRAWGQSPWGHL